MNWTRMILDGLTMSLFFNLVVVLGFLVTPMGYSVSLSFSFGTSHLKQSFSLL